MAAPEFQLNIWPPSERTRVAVVERMASTFSSPSVLSDKYGRFDREQAYAIAKKIEEEAFTASQDLPSSENGSHILLFYSKQIGKLMLETAKKQASNQKSDQHSQDLSEGASNPDPQLSES